MPAIVDTPEEARRSSSRRCWCAPLEAYLDAQGLGSGAVERRAGRRGPLERHLPDRAAAASAGCCAGPPRPPLPPRAHDVLREARLLRALDATACACPRVLATCDDEAVIGAPFYVMEHVEGDVIVSTIPAALDTTPSAARIGEELVDALVEVHAVDWQAIGLEGFGKPTGYLERQLRRFTGLWEHNRTRELATLDRVSEWLGANRPESPAGDDRPRRLPPRQRDGRAAARRRGSRRSSTGSWRRSATRSPTSATSSPPGPSPATPTDVPSRSTTSPGGRASPRARS